MLTDPPYGTTRLPWDREPPWRAFLALAQEALSERGNLILFASGRAVYLMAALEELSWPWYELVWPKRAPTGFYTLAMAASPPQSGAHSARRSSR